MLIAAFNLVNGTAISYSNLLNWRCVKQQPSKNIIKSPEKRHSVELYPPQKSFKMITNGQGPITVILGNIGLVIQSIVR